mmetsp:Transcript_6047/g.19347  ORF Transcript_6047/g.19347 Transcript_6047/m.19347 type:complete len:322 (+) Transcript_6047:468-1433(+)
MRVAGAAHAGGKRRWPGQGRRGSPGSGHPLHRPCGWRSGGGCAHCAGAATAGGRGRGGSGGCAPALQPRGWLGGAEGRGIGGGRVGATGAAPRQWHIRGEGCSSRRPVEARVRVAVEGNYCHGRWGALAPDAPGGDRHVRGVHERSVGGPEPGKRPAREDSASPPLRHRPLLRAPSPAFEEEPARGTRAGAGDAPESREQFGEEGRAGHHRRGAEAGGSPRRGRDAGCPRGGRWHAAEPRGQLRHQCGCRFCSRHHSATGAAALEGYVFGALRGGEGSAEPGLQVWRKGSCCCGGRCFAALAPDGRGCQPRGPHPCSSCTS